MSSVATTLVSYEEFQKLPDADSKGHYELHDGEVVFVPPPRPLHVAIQLRLVELLRAEFVGKAALLIAMEFPYKPAPNFQFWKADVAVVRRSIQEAMARWEDYEPYAPALIIEVESPSNTDQKVAKQRIAAVSNGTQEFWFVSARKETITVTKLDGIVKNYFPGDSIEVLGTGTQVSVNAIFFGE